MSASPRLSRVPAVVLRVRLPLAVTRASGFCALGCFPVLSPALLLCEAFAIIARLGYTLHFTSRRDVPIDRIIAGWLSVIPHTALLAMYFRPGR